ncbi:tumor necrosis factor receptor superfamily member 14-like [Pristis pectinata]|uniref:tumor necrosis factor receptor superfamily member 14-like n=1 Tax=Pristis pectinata TaxID=685728 RepID=UPI00223DA3B0|nr:tumor necrosis factor receptor superfamily member 14-like [Pristis pectinata]
MDSPSGQIACLRCRACDPDHGEVEQSPCTPSTPTTCSCAPGFVCSNLSPEVGCLSCTRDPCPAGQGVSKAGNDSWGSWCEPCAQGTFSSSPSQEPCTPWTKCGDRGLQTLRAGSPVSDAVCGREEISTLQTLAVALSGAVVGSLLLATVYVVRRRGFLLLRAEKLDPS